MRLIVGSVAIALTLLFASPAVATPVATSEQSYSALGRVFPDPLAGCRGGGEGSGCSPHARGNVPATQFVGVDEFVDAMRFMNTNSRGWSRYMEVLPLDGKMGDGSGSNMLEAFPGNNLATSEFTPDPKFQSAGLATTTGAKKKSDIYVVRVTDETVPDAGKKRYALSLSIHGIERAGVEGGTRAIEDLVTAATTPKAGGKAGETRLDEGILPGSFAGKGPTFRDALKKSIIYFSFPNPDGWRRGSVSAIPAGGSVFFQRYNGNGVDPNRDWPGVGYTFRPYSGLSEPESRALSSYFQQVKGTTGAEFAAGDDLHGQPEADALSYTLIPNASKTFDKNLRIRETSKVINATAFEALKWSPLIQSNDKPTGGATGCGPDEGLGPVCPKIYAQTWGTVYDTINYTTTGALGDWFDSPIGLDADGIDNEMSFSHLDKNIIFEPQTEQLHVDGNKFLIFAHVATIIDPALANFSAEGRKGYVPNQRMTRQEKDFGLTAPPNTEPQANEVKSVPTLDGSGEIPFEVKRTEPTESAPGIYNGGMRVDIRTTNAGGIGTGIATLEVQCKGCDDHPGVEPDDEGWITVQEDFNQSFIYAQAGITAAVNRPQAFNGTGQKVGWRAVVSGAPPGQLNLDVDFTSGPASVDGDTAGAPPSKLAGYDVANTDFFDTLNEAIPAGQERFEQVDPRKVIDGTQSLSGLRSLFLADDPLPGYLGPYSGDVPKPSGPPTADVPKFTGGGGTVPGGGSGAPGTFQDHKFTIGANDSNKSLSAVVTWGNGAANDWDTRLFQVVNGRNVQVGSSGNGPPTAREEITLEGPPAGDYILRVDNYAATGTYEGTVTFADGRTGETAVATGAYSVEDRDKWLAALEAYARGGGNLILTDGALRALPTLAGLPVGTVAQQPVYAGQMTFSKGTGAKDSTLGDPLAKDVAQPGARFNSGGRRQTYEPVPVGYSIQNATGGDASQARQFDIDRKAFEAAGGRVAATSTNSSPRSTAPVYTRVAMGEIPMDKGQIRVVAGLLPQPTDQFDHPFGLSPHGLTYTGYIIVCNLLGADCGVRTGTSVDTTLKPDQPAAQPQNRPATPVRPAGPTGPTVTACQSSAGFRSVSARRAGRSSVRLGFDRRVSSPVTVDVFRVSQGSRVVRERLVARFANRSKSFLWNGVSNREGKRKRVGTGYYFVRYTMVRGGKRFDVRRVVLRRSGGRFSKRPDYYRRATCDLLNKFKLERPVFGGPRLNTLKAAYRLASDARVRVTILKGSKVVKRYPAANRQARRTYRITLPARRRARGDYRVRVQAVGARDRVTSTLTSRRL
ncbi:MAG: hypothetical protein AVDCRST_MAG30-2140 [uncultured Solirubrobacteraceae bacterium]|uniref:Peptidase M14 domain-containing protein n=1 Tax=uncultured Solirubrobacteraceae bacterium TaxID=1162706 RepID=A0A6J4STM0_9ACTN|nr:MAG: hypothetical protein AVDCRST_MAG30-2140 [uncultured Solirubrobacteraceae bacterium]